MQEIDATLQNCFALVSKSPQNKDSLRVFSEDVGENFIAPKSLHKVRWLGRANCVRQIWLCYASWLCLFKQIAEEVAKTADQRSKAKDLLARFCSYEFIIWMAYTKDTTEMMAKLSKTTQVCPSFQTNERAHSD